MTSKLTQICIWNFLSGHYILSCLAGFIISTSPVSGFIKTLRIRTASCHQARWASGAEIAIIATPRLRFRRPPTAHCDERSTNIACTSHVVGVSGLCRIHSSELFR